MSGVHSTCDSVFMLNQKVKVKLHKYVVCFPPDMSHMTSAWWLVRAGRDAASRLSLSPSRPQQFQCFSNCQHFLVSQDEFLKSDPGAAVWTVLMLHD